MRQWRKLVGLVAIFGVLLHAGLIVRHSTSMIAAQIQHTELAAALGVICHGGGSAVALPASEIPNIPSELPASGGGTQDCPLCMGFGMASAVLPDRIAVRNLPVASSARQEIVAIIIARRMAAVRPPSTGPPSIA